MTDQPVSGAAPSAPAASGSQPNKMAVQGLANQLVRGLLRTPLLSRGVGKRLVTLYVVGRKSGRRYSVPVAYTRQDATLLVGSGFGWIRNLRTGDLLDIRYLGRRRIAEVQAYTDEAAVTELYAVICRDNRNFAGFNKIRLDSGGNPDPGDLHQAWAAGARVLRLTVR